MSEHKHVTLAETSVEKLNFFTTAVKIEIVELLMATDKLSNFRHYRICQTDECYLLVTFE